MTRRYTAVFELQAEGGYHASCPVLPGCHSEGDTIEEATSNIREAIEVYLESMIAHGEPVPTENILIRPIEIAAAG
ncbi:MAG TPA: type II toxin-antitoxin system HicB family antitoxin [Humisphaera sp.]|nr:type II toxin-antitoxin system HicB family antitoxin [Humisphaera sp.]